VITSELILNILLILAWVLGSVFTRFGLPVMLGELLAADFCVSTQNREKYLSRKAAKSQKIPKKLFFRTLRRGGFA
jgi:hypothetical protein